MLANPSKQRGGPKAASFVLQKDYDYLTTDWNRGEVKRLANWPSDEEKSTVSVPALESIVVSSIADFSIGDPEVFFMMEIPFIRVAAVAAVIVSDITTDMLKRTPLEKSIV